MDFITVSDLSKDIVGNISRIPKDIDVIVGVPRSCMLVANMIGLYINKPISDVESFCNERFYSSGKTKNCFGQVKKFEDIKKILLCEDSVSTGDSISRAKKKVADSFRGEVITLAAYVIPENAHIIDIWFRKIPGPRFFEWNYLHHLELRRTCFDLDGVLCVDPTWEENDNGEKYRNFILNAAPKLIPSQKIGWIVTSRLESFRVETEKWLQKQGIEYGELIMYQGSFEQRRRKNNHAEYKAKEYRRLKDALLFVESEPSQAERIRNITGKQVFCVTNVENYCPSWINRQKQMFRKRIPDSILGIPISKKAKKKKSE